MKNNTYEFKYERASFFAEPKERPLIRMFESYGQLTDITTNSSWTKHRLYQIYDKAGPILSNLQQKANTVQKLELNDYNDVAKERRRRDHLREPYINLLELISEERRASKQAIENLKSHAIRMSETTPPDDIPNRISYDSKMIEIRSLLRQKNMQERIEMINGALTVNDSSFLHAAISSPDEIIPKNKLQQIRMNYAYKQNSTLENALNDAIKLADAIEQRTGQLGGTAIAILQSKELEIPISKLEYFQFFPSKTAHEAEQKQRIVHNEEQLLTQRKTFEDAQHATSAAM